MASIVNEKSMRVLFVSGGNIDRDDPVVMTQTESLTRNGVDVENFFIIGKGIKGYLKNVLLLRKRLTLDYYDIIHAHYSYCGVVATLASFFKKTPTIVSLMGSDVLESKIWKYIVKVYM